MLLPSPQSHCASWPWEYSQSYVVQGTSKITHSFGPGSPPGVCEDVWSSGSARGARLDSQRLPGGAGARWGIDRDAALLGVGSALDPKQAGARGGVLGPSACHLTPPRASGCYVVPRLGIREGAGERLAQERCVRVGGVCRSRGNEVSAGSRSWIRADCKASLSNWIAAI